MEGMEGDEGKRRQLLALKKELKCWESMFERKHGRKPSKEDVEQSPLEVKDTYRQYQRLKSSGKRVMSKDAPCDDPSPTDTAQSVNGNSDSCDGEEVFGCHLNKKEVTDPHSGTGESNKGPVWKLRKWTKDGGYKTVVGGGGGTPSELCTRDMRSNANTLEEEITKNEEDETTDISTELRALSQGMNVKVSSSPQKRSQSMDKGVNVVRRYQSGKGRPALRMGHKLSGIWLQRCRPELDPEDFDTLDPRGSDNTESISTGVGVSSETVSFKADPGSGRIEIIEDGHSSTDCAEEIVDDEGEEMWAEDVLIEDEEEEEEEEKKGEEEQEKEGEEEEEETALSGEEVTSREDEDEEDEEGCGGWDGRLEDDEHTSDNLFDPTTRHSVSLPVGNYGHAQNVQAQTTEQSVTQESYYPMMVPSSKSVAMSESPCPAQCVQLTSRLGFLDKEESYTSVQTSVTANTECSKKKWKLQETRKGDETITKKAHDTRPARMNTRSKVESVSRECSDRVMDSVTHSDTQSHGSSDNALKRSTKVPAQKKSSGSQNGAVKELEPERVQAAVSPVFSSNAVSENFVRLNLKVKRFSHSKPGRISGSAYKRKMWKKAQRTSSGSSFGPSGRGGARTNACFKCGKPGHWAKNCTERQGSKNLGCFAGEKVQFNENMELGNEELDRETLQRLARESPFPTTREAALMGKGVSLEQSRQRQVVSEDGGGADEREQDSFQALPPCRVDSPSPPPAMEPLVSADCSEDVQELMTSALKKLGHHSFRHGQAETTARILSGVSTLLVQPTGAGKSLCYQLPAFLYSQRSSCITLVISPLVSLMEDQVCQFPPCLKGACLHTNQTQSQRQRIMADVAEGRVDVLLLSPEALVSGTFWSGWGKRAASKLPPVAFACIDEAHCVSEWSHNFRPSYLRVCKVLRERLGVQCMLGLTATATRTTALSVASHLNVTEENIIRGSTVPSNLNISVSCDENRDEALLQLLQSSKMRGCDSIIIYCTRQMETERVAQLLRTSLQFLPTTYDQQQQQSSVPSEDVSSGDDDSSAAAIRGRKRKRTLTKSSSRGKKAKKAKLDWSVDSYHAGMSAGERKRIQTAFMTGRLRIVVATVAFGMGLNKSDVRAIIHYNVPKSFESYVQEIGRAGRDGKPAFCHVFIDKEGEDLCELRRHAYSSTIDPYSIKQLVTKVFPSCQCRPPDTDLQSDEPGVGRAPKPLGSRERWCAGHEVAVAIEHTVQAFDTKEECIQTLLCYLELQQWLEMKGIKKDVCTLKCYGGARQLRALAQKVPAVAAATARMQEKGTNLDMQSSISFSCVEVAGSMGWESYILRSELRDLQFNDRQTSSSSSSSVVVEFSDPSFHLLSPGDLSPRELDHVRNYLQERVKAQETLEVDKLHLLYSVLRSVASDSIYEYFVHEENQNQKRLMELVSDYFEDKLDCSTAAEMGITVLKLPSEIPAKLEAEISRDVRSLMSIHTERNFSGRTIARLFHGISSPCFPAEVWAKQKQFWRRHLNVDFNVLCQIATRATLQIMHAYS